MIEGRLGPTVQPALKIQSLFWQLKILKTCPVAKKQEFSKFECLTSQIVEFSGHRAVSSRKYKFYENTLSEFSQSPNGLCPPHWERDFEKRHFKNHQRLGGTCYTKFFTFGIFYNIFEKNNILVSDNLKWNKCWLGNQIFLSINVIVFIESKKKKNRLIIASKKDRNFLHNPLRIFFCEVPAPYKFASKISRLTLR